MTIRARLTAWYAITLFISLLLFGAGTYREISEQLGRLQAGGRTDSAVSEVLEMILQVGLPVIILALAGGWWLTRRALAPLTILGRAAEGINERNLGEQLPRTCNGDELDRLTEVLNAMTSRLYDSFTRVREFTLHASHELKTPLTVLCGEAEVALGGDSLTPAQREIFASQLVELQRLAQIVDGLTLLAKADSGLVRLSRVPVRLDELVRDSFADSQILAHGSGIKVELAACAELTVSGDKHRLRQLLLNLADNAIKYNQPNGWVTMAVHRDGKTAEFIITNSSLGIPPESLPRIFDRFYRGDPAHSHTVDGCGLGLSIAEWIVSAHNGTIRVTSMPSKHTTITVRLPLCLPET